MGRGVTSQPAIAPKRPHRRSGLGPFWREAQMSVLKAQKSSSTAEDVAPIVGLDWGCHRRTAERPQRVWSSP